LALLSPLGFIAVVDPLFSAALPHHDAKRPSSGRSNLSPDRPEVMKLR
jgi:hypothetical protein